MSCRFEPNKKKGNKEAGTLCVPASLFEFIG